MKTMVSRNILICRRRNLDAWINGEFRITQIYNSVVFRAEGINFV